MKIIFECKDLQNIDFHNGKFTSWTRGVQTRWFSSWKILLLERHGSQKHWFSSISTKDCLNFDDYPLSWHHPGIILAIPWQCQAMPSNSSHTLSFVYDIWSTLMTFDEVCQTLMAFVMRFDKLWSIWSKCLINVDCFLKRFDERSSSLNWIVHMDVSAWEENLVVGGHNDVL